MASENGDDDLVRALKEYLVATAPNFLNGNVETFVAAAAAAQETLKMYVADSQIPVLVINKKYSKELTGEESPEEVAAAELYTFQLEIKDGADAGKMSIAYIKIRAKLDMDSSISSQLNVCQLSRDNPIGAILAYVRSCFLPYSRSIMAGALNDEKSSEQDLGVIRGVNSKLGELEVELLRSQQTEHIPNVTLPLHPKILSLVDEKGDNLKVADLDSNSDPVLLKELEGCVVQWTKAIFAVTSLTRDVDSGTTMQEINFWSSMEKAVEHIYTQRDSTGVAFTFQVLKENQRVRAHFSFNEDSGLALDKGKDKVYKYSSLMRDFPIKALLAATEISDIEAALELIFNHMKQIRRIEYPLPRAVEFMHAISRDTMSQLQLVLNSRRPMWLNYNEFSKANRASERLFTQWDTSVEGFHDEIRDLQKVRKDEEVPSLTRPYQHLSDLRTRLSEVSRIRKEHEELQTVIEDTLTTDPTIKASALSKMNQAFQHLREVDALSITKEGTTLWENALTSYKAKIDLVEGELETKIRQMLEAAKDDANEMFRVCARFKALFVRPRIQGVIRNHQDALIGTVKRDIDRLEAMFKNSYAKSEAHTMSQIRDLPPVSGSIIWAMQIERQLDMYMSRVEDVLGPKWHHHVEGRHLKRDSEQFRERLQPHTIFEEWMIETKDEASFNPQQRIFKIEESEKAIKLAVNFDPHMITLFKELRHFNRLQLKVPFDLVLAAEEAKGKYPYAVRLDEVVRIYSRASRLLDPWPDLKPLAASYKKVVQDSIAEGMFFQWDTQGLDHYVARLGTETADYQDKVEDLLGLTGKTTALVERLGYCTPSAEVFKGIIGEMQEIVDHLGQEGFSNLAAWVTDIDTQVEAVLCGRLKTMIGLWVEAQDIDLVTSTAQVDLADEHKQVLSREQLEARRKAMPFVLREPCRHKVIIRNQVLHLEPPLEHGKLIVTKNLHSILAGVAELPRLQRFWNVDKTEGIETYRSALSKLSTEDLFACFAKIDAKVTACQEYAETWMQYQALWDLDVEVIVKACKNHPKKWQKIIKDVNESKSHFDGGTSEKRFGPLLVDYKSVQMKVNNKYQSWHTNILNRFGDLVGGNITTLNLALSDGRKTLEQFKFDYSTTDSILESVSLMNDMKKKAVVWKEGLAETHAQEDSLREEKYEFPPDWISTAQLDNEWQLFDQILGKRQGKMDKEKDKITETVNKESDKLEKRIRDFLQDWKTNKPVGPDLDHHVVLNALMKFDGQLTHLSDEVSRMAKAKEALGIPAQEEHRLTPVREEIDELKGVWQVLGDSWKQLEDIGDTLFCKTKVKELRKDLAGLNVAVQRLPNSMRQYSGYETLRKKIKSCQDLNAPLTELGSGILREKHQKQILKILRIDDRWDDITVNQLWAKDIKRHMKQIRFILEQAQGESALEEFLHEIEEAWMALNFDCVNYRNKNFLIKNWDDIFEQVGDNLTDLSSMKHSPFYPAFELEASRWEKKLNHAQSIFDLFIDVQRRWVYLEGIFNNSVEVQQQLAYQYKRFVTFDREFIRQMREIERAPQCDPWVKEDRHLLPTVEGWTEILDGIQKALGEWLEKQRAAFPRFYFVGDEDLLEIIGNSKNVLKLLRHLPKMFAGLCNLMLSEDNLTILGMQSPEGEQVTFAKKIDTSTYKTIHAWLHELEHQMRFTLASMLQQSMDDIKAWRKGDDGLDKEKFFEWVDKNPSQIALLSLQIDYSEAVDVLLQKGQVPESCLKKSVAALDTLANNILQPGLAPDRRKKYEQLITELVHQRDVCREMIHLKVNTADNYYWLGQLRYYFNVKPKGIVPTGDTNGISSELIVCVSRAAFYYGFEYLGVSEKLVQTPLTDRCYLTMCEALHMRMGGNPYGPAGTGKTESVKALGAQLGRFVLVFNCDENFDLQSMGRIMIGLCQVGAWGCFDEFNRLEERILSAVSQQILTIQTGLREHKAMIPLLGRDCKLSDNMGMFVTMNPGYAGRSNLPDNLKQLFRGLAMIAPDTVLIGQVMLYSQGFATAEEISGKVVMLFSLCKDQLSEQSHYDFGLRALKSVLRSAGNLKRKVLVRQQTLAQLKDGSYKPRELENFDKADEEELLEGEEAGPRFEDVALLQKNLEADELVGMDISSVPGEIAIIVKSISGTIVPKLVADDIPLFGTLLTAVFPGMEVSPPTDEELLREIHRIAIANKLQPEQAWVDKIMQLDEILSIHHGVIMVGPSGTGKSSGWNTLRRAQEAVTGKKIITYIIDPKAMTKDDLYGVLDSTTLEWTDGVLTHIIRKITDNVRGEASKNHWLIFDGDVDPEWAENLNSVLDDNKLLTLPNGERLALTPNIRLCFECLNLDYATPATVSRCGMVWFSERVVTDHMVLANLFERLRSERLPNISPTIANRWKDTQLEAADTIKRFFMPDDSGADERSFLLSCLRECEKYKHVMEYSRARALMSTFAMLKSGISKLMEYNEDHPDFPKKTEEMQSFMSKQLMYSALWGFGGDLPLAVRVTLGAKMCEFAGHNGGIECPPPGQEPLIDWEVTASDSKWHLWNDRVPEVDLAANKLQKPDIVISTVDTTRHVDVISAWLGDGRPLLLCGPPGSGKSMTLTSVLRERPDFELVTLNFSSTSGTELIHRTLKHYCEASKTPKGVVIRPTVRNKILVIFCDEINLPMQDLYGTQRVITLLRQITEHGGFWRASDLSWVALERIQIIGACNPPEDAGRVALSPRMLRHCPLMFVDFPSVPSLKQIYGTFNRALVKLQPQLKNYANQLTDSMVEVYCKSQARFTPDLQPHYIYSPRELSRWVRAMFEAMNPETSGGVSLSLDDLVRLWTHEALRLFSDRLVEVPEREWTDRVINDTARKYYPTANLTYCLQRPVLYSDWLEKKYVSVEQEDLRTHIKLRLQVFREEELDIKLVIFDEVLEHILRIDRVLRQPLGHLLLVGASGSGKTVLSKFVAWMSGMSVFQIKVHKFYTAVDFDHDLRTVLIRSGCHMERVCFIFDESNVLDSAFLERMNALLASGEVPGLFEGADWTALMEECKMAASRENINETREDELYKIFCSHVQRNLHVVFTMNPSNEDFDNRAATSPALFNRCVVDWFGEWSSTALYQVGHEFTTKLQLSDAPPGAAGAAAALETKAYDSGEDSDEEQVPMQMGSGTERDCVVSSLVYVHESVFRTILMLARNTNKRTYVTPRHFLDFIKHYAQLSGDKRTELEEQQRHLNSGLRKLNETQVAVAKLKEELEVKKKELAAKEGLANTKLEQIMVDQVEAEQKQDVSKQIQKEIAAQEIDIQERKAQVEQDLSTAKPALEDAQAAVRNIKKSDLDVVRRFPSPPAAVQLALEPVVIMLSGKKNAPVDWSSIRKFLSKSTFIKDILELNVDKLKEPLRKHVEKKYFSDPNFSFDTVNNASRACGPLVKWVMSTCQYADIKSRVQPLIDQMTGLEEKQNALQEKATELENIVQELGERLAGFKVEHSALVGEAQVIKAEMSGVLSKVSRAENLLANLSVEQVRWDEDSKNYESQISTIVGDALVAAAFLAYVGYFNQAYREMLIEKWVARLKEVGVRVRDDLSVIEYLSHPAARFEWKNNGLPDDDLCRENAIMMKKFNRYPLIIDPSGQATGFLMKQYKERKIIRTSFLDKTFLKNLETSVRFGNALLVEDVEHIDPILNSVLNKEIFRQGGRIMIAIGDKEIDFSPSFVIFLSTRDPACHFTPDLCSRVTFVNFTVTHSSLTTQCLGKLLRVERQDIDQKRSDMLKLQGEFRVRLRALEDKLLTSLSAVEGNILDNEKVIGDLETLKSEAAEVTQKMADADTIMAEVELVSSEYRPFAVACSSIYFTLENMGLTKFLYQFNLNFMFVMIDRVLLQQSDKVLALKDPQERLKQLTRELFEECFTRVTRGLLNKDQLAFGLRLAQIALSDTTAGAHPGKYLDFMEIEFFLKGRTKTHKSPDAKIVKALSLSNPQQMLLSGLLTLPAFANLSGHLSSNLAEWTKWVREVKDARDTKLGEILNQTPTGWEKQEEQCMKLFNQLLICKVFRPDKTMATARAFLNSVFGHDFLQCLDTVNLGEVVRLQSDANRPFLLVSLPGYDASSKVDALAAERGVTYQSFAMGSPEGYELANRAINVAAVEGSWVLLKNVHLSPKWLVELEQKLHRMTPHADFRLFMTMELNEKVPSALIRLCDVLVFEPAVGIKSSMIRAWNAMPENRVNAAPAARGHLHFLLAWTHSIIMERLRYAPVGWTKTFEFGETDLRCAMDAVDEWVDKKAGGKDLPVNKIPWDALQALIEQVIYGGRVDNEFDQARLSAFTHSVFVPESFNKGFALCTSWDDAAKSFKSLLDFPNAKDYAGFKAWIDNLSDESSPEMLGLPGNAEQMLLTLAGDHLTLQLLNLQDHEADAQGDEADNTVKESKRLSFSLGGDVSADRPPWMVALEQSNARWLSHLPKASIMKPLPTGAKLEQLVLNPLFRCLKREFDGFHDILVNVISDLELVRDVVDSKVDANNRVRKLFVSLKLDRSPAHWIKYGGSLKKDPTSLWIPDFAKRVIQMSELGVTPAAKLGDKDIWLGGLMTPEAFVAATRQSVAQDNNWSLEELFLQVTVDDKSTRKDSFTFTGLELYGASWAKGHLSIDNDQLSCKLPPTRFTWVRKEKGKEGPPGDNVLVPVYLDLTRQQYLFSVLLKRPSDIPDKVWNMRGVCLTVWGHSA